MIQVNPDNVIDPPTQCCDAETQQRRQMILVFTSELDGGDGGRVVVQSLLQTVVLLRVEDVD